MDTNDKSDHWLSNGAYDLIRLLAMIILPALGTLYFALASIWHLPDGKEIVGTITAIDTFLGGFVSISRSQYMNSDARFVGSINVADDPEGTKKVYSLDLKGDPEEHIDGKDTVTFKVNPVPS